MSCNEICKPIAPMRKFSQVNASDDFPQITFVSDVCFEFHESRIFVGDTPYGSEEPIELLHTQIFDGLPHGIPSQARSKHFRRRAKVALLATPGVKHKGSHVVDDL